MASNMAMQRLRWWPIPILAALALPALLNAPGAAAQSGTPTPAGEIPLPAECTVAPRSTADLRALFRQAAATPHPELPAATPSAPPPGEPADAATVTAINATWREYVACLSSGDQPRMFALLSDALVLRQMVVDIAFGVDEQTLLAFFAATPIPIPTDQLAPITPFTDVRVLSDGRVAAVGPGENGRGDVRIFRLEGDRWVIDDWYDLSAG